MNDWKRPFQKTDGSGGPSLWGVSHTLCFAILLIDLPIVSRGTLRSVIPAGTTVKKTPISVRGTVVRKASRMSDGCRRAVSNGLVFDNSKGSTSYKVNSMSQYFIRALTRMEASGWVERGSEFIKVVNKEGMEDWIYDIEISEKIEMRFEYAYGQILNRLSSTSLPSGIENQLIREAESLESIRGLLPR